MIGGYGWLVVWLVGGMVGWMIGWLVGGYGWLDGCLVVWMDHGWLDHGWLVGGMIGWLEGRMERRLDCFIQSE